MTHRKRLSAPKKYPIERKKNTYIADSNGSRERQSSVPLIVAFRDILGVVQNRKELVKALNQGKIEINGHKANDVKQSVGPLDLVTAGDEDYRVMAHPQIVLLREAETASTIKKIVSKRDAGETYQYGFHNGSNMRSQDDFETGTTVVRKGEDISTHALEEEKEAYVIEGSHAGKKATIETIHNNGRNEDMVELEGEGHQFQTNLNNVVAVGSDFHE